MKGRDFHPCRCCYRTKGVEAIEGALEAKYVGTVSQDNEVKNIPFFLGPACSKHVEGNEQGRFSSAGDS